MGRSNAQEWREHGDGASTPHKVAGNVPQHRLHVQRWRVAKVLVKPANAGGISSVPITAVANSVRRRHIPVLLEYVDHVVLPHARGRQGGTLLHLAAKRCAVRKPSPIARCLFNVRCVDGGIPTALKVAHPSVGPAHSLRVRAALRHEGRAIQVRDAYLADDKVALQVWPGVGTSSYTFNTAAWCNVR